MSIFFSDNPTNLWPRTIFPTPEHLSSPPDDTRKKADLAGPGIGDCDELERFFLVTTSLC